jgi:hypothetical protein
MEEGAVGSGPGHQESFMTVRTTLIVVLSSLSPVLAVAQQACGHSAGSQIPLRRAWRTCHPSCGCSTGIFSSSTDEAT